MPKSITDYWIPKKFKNVEKNKNNKTELEKLGWNVLTIWGREHRKESREHILMELYKEIIESKN